MKIKNENYDIQKLWHVPFVRNHFGEVVESLDVYEVKDDCTDPVIYWSEKYIPISKRFDNQGVKARSRKDTSQKRILPDEINDRI